MFPLGRVLLPGMVLPLRVFEPRYRALTRRCLDNDEQFGVALIERGSEVGGGDVRTRVGCLARIMQSREFDDGQWALVALGTERVVVEQWLPDDPYPRAVTTSWQDDPEGATRSDLDRVEAKLRATLEYAASLGMRVPTVELTADDDLVARSYELCVHAPVGSFDRHQLLGDAGPADRVRRLDGLLDDVTRMLEARAGGMEDPPASGML